MDALLDVDAIRDSASDAPAPFRFMVLHDVLPRQAQVELDRDFPAYTSAGFFPYDPAECGASVRRVVEQMTSRDFGDAIGAQLGIEGLGSKPTLTTLCRLLNRRHGTIHTDSRSKIVTALLYLNADWPDTSDGCLRFLSDIDALVAPEIRPVYGTLVAFRRADNSFHGHLPFEGERRVIQVAWLTSEKEAQRKSKRGRFSRLIKKLFGRLDRRFGAGRADNASHPD